MGEIKGSGVFFQRKSFDPSPSKPILNEIDRMLAAHYGFTDEELDLIPSTNLRAGNYDIKYQMDRNG